MITRISYDSVGTNPLGVINLLRSKDVPFSQR